LKKDKEKKQKNRESQKSAGNNSKKKKNARSDKKAQKAKSHNDKSKPKKKSKNKSKSEKKSKKIVKSARSRNGRSRFDMSSKSVKKALLIWAGIVLLLIFGGIIFYFRDAIFLLIPGVYENKNYNEITSEKNDLIDDNLELIEENDKIGEEIDELGGSLGDLSTRIEKNKQILQNLEEIEQNISKIIEYDQEINVMRLPGDLSRYVQESKELDKLRKELIEAQIDYVNSKIDMNIFNERRAAFDKCLSEVNWDGADDDIAEGISNCVSIIDEIQGQIELMEDNYDTELPELTNYFTLRKAQWEARVEYYKALERDEYEEANEHDDEAVAKKREINEIDIEVFNEFYDKVVKELENKFQDLADDEMEKQDEVDDLYQKYIEG
jgi:hypothetical protein